jgi:hypothetical protein
LSAIRGPTGLFLGSGASFDLGMPLVWELTNEIKTRLTEEKIRSLNANWRIRGGGYPDQVIDDLVDMLKRPNCHYEAILGYIETQFRRQHALSQAYHGIYSWLVELVYQILYMRQTKNHAIINHTLPRYDGISALVAENAPLRIFSLNHDVMIEAIAARLGIPLHSGFSASTVTLPCRDPVGRIKGEIQAAVLARQEHERGAMHFPNPPEPGIYLLKIHGALDIFAFNDGHDLLKLLPNAPGMEGILDVLRAANEELLYSHPDVPGGKVKVINEIAYADALGEMQFLRRSLLAGAYKFDPRRSQVLPMGMLTAFRNNLNFVSTLVCIGYGFGDLHINTVMRDWLEFTTTRRLEIVSPDVKNVPSFLLHLSPQVILTPSDTTAYLDSRAAITRTRLEKLEKRLFSAARWLGQERARAAVASFRRREHECIAQALRSRLKTLPHVEGQPDFGELGGPVATANRWSEEMKHEREELLERFVTELENKGDN